MKIGKFEGTTDEFNDICENQGFKPDDFLITPTRFQPKIGTLIGFVIAFGIISILLWIFELNPILNKILIIVNLIVIIFITILIQLRFDKWLITIITFLGGLIIFSVCLNYITPEDAIDEMKKTINIKESE